MHQLTYLSLGWGAQSWTIAATEPQTWESFKGMHPEAVRPA